MSKALIVAVALAVVSASSAYAGPCKIFGNNGWGNGGFDGTNNGSSKGGGVSGGGQGAGQSQTGTKLPDADR